MLKRIVIGVFIAIVVIVGGLAVVVATQPEEFQVTRTTSVKARPDVVFDQINDFHNWDKWSPWAKLDPNMKTTYSGAQSGVGSSYAWVGNDDVGEGKMTVIESRPGEQVKIDLDFIKPFAAKNLTEFSLKPDGDNTQVTWAMTGKKNFVSKAFCLVMDMDKMVGGDFERGLAQMKTVVESAAQ
jgi:carbon monoxide dehydrogenase subunit G